MDYIPDDAIDTRCLITFTVDFFELKWKSNDPSLPNMVSVEVEVEDNFPDQLTNAVENEAVDIINNLFGHNPSDYVFIFKEKE